MERDGATGVAEFEVAGEQSIRIISCSKGDRIEKKVDDLTTKVEGLHESFDNHFSELKKNGRWTRTEKLAALPVLAGAIVQIIQTIMPYIL